MAKKLGPDGVPVEVPSTRPKSDRSIFDLTQRPRPADSGDAPTVPTNKPAGVPSYDDEPPTRPMTGPGPRGFGVPDDGEPRTRIAGGPRRPPKPAPTPNTDAGASPAYEAGVDDPVVGWLVIVDGPGKGSFVRIGNGQNSIGRGDKSRVRLDFGDSEISRENHAVVTYDPKGNRYFVQQADGVNLVYRNGDPVLVPTPLLSGDSISMGQTSLRFVALCGVEFRWQDSEQRSN